MSKHSFAESNPVFIRGRKVVALDGDFPGECYVFHPDAMRRMFGPGVYILSGEQGCLYVGSAQNILRRISDDDHSSFRMALCEATHIEFQMARSTASARENEAVQIAARQPKYNKVGKSTPFIFPDEDPQIVAFTSHFRSELENNLAQVDWSNRAA